MSVQDLPAGAWRSKVCWLVEKTYFNLLPFDYCLTNEVRMPAGCSSNERKLVILKRLPVAILFRIFL